ncbi:polysaccharide lyase family 8 super-sandwich domain-containing protein [Pseudalkalibacillus decolorationis]|uniref:polysaccharide lyase family 8 super-sandwich domain-containing protein n=1 Tax=Pseudalkalibacillus decolorationis TaxID=163879 RepID=UPI0021488323|nr:polysaccharide lyase family 8 super-sandwich domain-containing protein [Pseudalkalibacillus decolorationis]
MIRKKRFKLISVFLTALLIVPMMTVYLEDAYAAEETDEFDNMREKWKDYLTGGSGFDSDDPDISAYIENLVLKVKNEEGTGHWDTMNIEDNRAYLWNDLDSTSDPSAISGSYNRLKDMALAYSIKGSELYQAESLKQDIINGLDWLYLNRYNEKKSQYGNWWHWEIGTPMAFKDLLVLMYDDLTSTQIANYIKAIDRFVPDPVHRVRFPGVIETGANRMDKALIVSIRGIVGKDSDKIAEARDALSQVFNYVTDGDGFYKDGSFVQHNYIAYTGSYGIVLMDHLVDVLYLLAGSSWEVTDTNLKNVYQWVFDSYEPLIYKGAMMDMVRGRAISRQNSSDHSAGRSLIIPILQLSEAAPPDVELRIKRMVKYWVQSDTTFENFVSGLNISDMISVKSLINDSMVSPRGELIKHQVFASMDRIVHRRPGFGFGISMSSNRIANFEYINQENKKGWYTGYGMTYLYNNDLEQFSEGYWPTVDMFRLPGTTTDGSQGTLKNDYYYRSPKTWVGGASIDGMYGAAGMEFDIEKSTLTGKKSWFSFDDEIVALGAGITGSDNRKVETIVENRKLNENGNNVFTVNGETKSSQLGWSEKMESVKWAHLEGNVPKSNIGYYFPEQSTVFGMREERLGSWKDINVGGSTNLITKNFLSLAFNHGINPTNSSYSYVLLPNKDVSGMEHYNDKPDIEILSNTSTIHAVKEKKLGLTAANFWERGTVDFIRSYQPASVMIKEEGDELTIAVSDPTQKQDKITIELGKKARSVISKDDSVTVSRMVPYTKVEIDVSGSLGKTHTVKLNYNLKATAKLPPTSHINVDVDKALFRGDEVSVAVTVTNDGERVQPEGKIALDVSDGWTVEPDSLKVPALHPNESHTLNTKIAIPEYSEYGKYEINATLKAGNTTRTGSKEVQVVRRFLKLVAVSENLEGIVIEGEDFSEQGGGSVNIADKQGASEGKAINMWDDSGHWLEWKVNVPESGNYKAIVRYSTDSDTSKRDFAIDGGKEVNFHFPSTNGWSSWSDMMFADLEDRPLTFELKAGEHEIHMNNLSSPLNVDYIKLVKVN